MLTNQYLLGLILKSYTHLCLLQSFILVKANFKCKLKKNYAKNHHISGNMAQYMDNMSEWSDMSTHGLLFQW